MREVEVKARVRDAKKLLKSLEERGIKLGPAVKQHDVVYGAKNAKGGESDLVWLRIRTENDQKHIFTLKKSVVGHLDSIEHETEVSDPVALFEIFKAMGYELYSDITKLRRKAKDGNIELCYDELPSLGAFIEAEKMFDEDVDHEAVVGELWLLLTSLGIDKQDEIHEGYDVLERRQRGL